MLKNCSSGVDVAFSSCEYAKLLEENINIRNIAANKTEYKDFIELSTARKYYISIIIHASELINEGAGVGARFHPIIRLSRISRSFMYSLLQLLVHYPFLLSGLLAHYHLESPARLSLQIVVNELFRIDNVYSKSSKFYLE